MSDETTPPSPLDTPPEENESGTLAAQKQGTNDYFRKMFERNFLDYASYVIGSRAIPDVDDGLKPVQRRILWTLYLIYDNGRTTKTANVVGNAMHFHPHGDASIGDALVVLANKGGCVERMEKERDGKQVLHYINVPYFIRKEGNFGNVLTGSPAAAARYTECALTKLAFETMFNDDITSFVPNYDGREKEPVLLPAKVPSLLMMGSDGIAVGMSTLILPHNFNELLDAEIADLKGEPFRLYPDFQQGGVMDVREYDDGNGKIVLRARIDIEGRELVIREIPATCSTASLISSIERAAEKNKIRISSINDFTTDHAEIRVVPTRGYDPEKTRQGLFMYTDCSVSISPKMTVICEHRPQQMSVSEVLKRNVRKLVGFLTREFEIDLERQNELRHAKTLAQLFFENRIYKRIEECKSAEEEYKEVLEGLAPFRDQLLRDISKEDVDKLLALPVRRIARFDIEKNQQELREIAEKIKEIKHNLKHITEYTIGYLEELKKKYGADFPRRTEIEQFEQIDRHEAALNNIKIGWDRKNGYIGSAVKSDDVVVCNEFDRFILLHKEGDYKIISLPPEKSFIGKMYEFRKYDTDTEFAVIYREVKAGKYYGKRMRFGSFILEKEYRLCPPGCKIELFTPRPDAVYVLKETTAKGKETEREVNLMEFPQRSAKARGILIGSKQIAKITHLRYLTPEELEVFKAAESVPEEPEEETDVAEETPFAAEVAPVPEKQKPQEEQAVPPEKSAPEEVPAPAEEEPSAPATEENPGPTEEEPSAPAAEENPVTAEEEPFAPEKEPSALKEEVVPIPEAPDEKQDAPEIPEEAVPEEDVPEPEAPNEKQDAPEIPEEADKPEKEPKTQLTAPLLELDGNWETPPPRHSRVKKQNKKTDPAVKLQSEEDDLGIVQPEFGF